MKNKIQYYIIYYIWYAFACLPACIHYFNAYLISVLLFHVIRYRRKLVHKNITDSFPKKSAKECLKIERQFYTHFCNILVESVMFLAMSRKRIMQHMKFVNIEAIERSCKNGHSCGVYLGHYANWEWISSLQQWIDPEIGKCVQLYHALENPVFNKIVNYTRERFGSTNIPVAQSARHMVKYRKEGKPLIIGFIADQVPFWNNIHYWTNFLNHAETPVFNGPERIIKQMDMDVYYLDVRVIKRGYYEAEFKLLAENPKELEENVITEYYTRALEKTIQAAPQYWLWSHNRWKRTKDRWLEMYDEASGKVIMNQH